MVVLKMTNYVRPHGTKEQTELEVIESLGPKIAAIADAGFEVTSEYLPGNLVSLTISDEHGDYASRVIHAPHTLDTLQEMIEKFDIDAGLAESSRLQFLGSPDDQ